MAWARHVGGPGLIVLGILDNSAVPVPGSQDVLVVILAASARSLWFYYGFMATLGAVFGGAITYRLARREGRAILHRRASSRRMQQIETAFAKWGFGAVMIPALLPPPLPTFPFLLAAGALEYPAGKFFTALAAGRGLRYMVLAYFAAQYGGFILGAIRRYHDQIIIGGISAVAAIAIYLLLRYRRSKRPSQSQHA
jgi:membrane protein YqaA with SNARE-associated domain